MRLLKKDLDKRLNVKLDKSIVAKGANINGIMSFGKDNDYPQKIEMLINSSKTAKAVAKIYAKFLTGSGFENEAINNIVVGVDERGQQVTVIKLLRKLCMSLAHFNGGYVHTSINIERKIKELKIIPFKYCRFAKIDDTGYSPKIGVYSNWDKDPDAKFDKNKIVFFNAFNLNESAFISQINAIDGDTLEEKISKFKGQVSFLFLDDQYLYPLSPFDPVYLDCDTEQQVSIFMNSQTRNGMTDKTVLRVAEPSNTEDRDELLDDIESWQGVDGSNTLVLTDEIDANGEIKKTGAFAIDTIKSNINDALFSTWDKTLSNSIRKSVNALPAVLIDYEESKLGTTSGEAIIQATNYYNAMTRDDRKAIEEYMESMLKNFDNPALQNNTNWKIKEVELYAKEESTTDPLDVKLKAQAELKGSVGGVTALIQLQQSISQGYTTKEAGISILKEIYGIDEATANEMVGNPKKEQNDNVTNVQPATNA